jgi:hypothetical protein
MTNQNQIGCEVGHWVSAKSTVFENTALLDIEAILRRSFPDRRERGKLFGVGPRPWHTATRHSRYATSKSATKIKF